MRLPLAVIGILAEDHDLRFGVGCVVERIEDRIHVGKDAARAVLFDEEAAQFLIVGLFHLVGEQALPIVLKNLHGNLSFVHTSFPLL